MIEQTIKQTIEEHKSRHVELHNALDELLADYALHTGGSVVSTTAYDLLKWSHKQTTDPDTRDKVHELSIEFYFCEVDNITKRRIFHITPKKFFDSKGFLLDAHIDIDIEGFQCVCDSTFEYIGKHNPETILMTDGRFAYRDMDGEIKYKYLRGRALGIDESEKGEQSNIFCRECHKKLGATEVAHGCINCAIDCSE